MRSKSQYSLYNIRYQSQMHRNEINVLRSRSASFERTMPCPLTIPKTNKKTFHVISRKKKSKSTSVIEEHTRNQFQAEKFDRCHWSTHTQSHGAID